MVYDRWLFFTAGLLVVAGLFMVGSASQYLAMSEGKTPYAILLKQAIHLMVGIAGLVAALSLPYEKLAQRWVVLLLIGLSVAGLLTVLMMPAAGGAQRWIRWGPFTVQPSEFAKLAVVVFMAWMLARKKDRINELWSVPVPCMAVVGILAYLVYVEPDLGSATMLVALACVMLFVAGVRWRYIGVATAVGLVGFVVAVIAEPYRLERVKAFLRPDADSLGAGFQLSQSLIALGSGGVTGVGPGQGQQKAFFLPAAHTDFIFSVVGEELGLVGTGVLLLAFVLLFWRGMRTAMRAPDRFGFFLALGITNLLVLQALINMAVCSGLLPTKGLPLPFISYGGSSLVASMVAVGLLLNVSKHSN
jgi:cell division protein FtsW